MQALTLEQFMKKVRNDLSKKKLKDNIIFAYKQERKTHWGKVGQR